MRSYPKKKVGKSSPFEFVKYWARLTIKKGEKWVYGRHSLAKSVVDALFVIFAKAVCVILRARACFYGVNYVLIMANITGRRLALVQQQNSG